MTEETSKPESFMSHLIELRDRLLRMVLTILVIFLMLFYWANDIYTYLAAPLTAHLPEGQSMIAIDVASPFLTPFKLVLMLSIFLSMPMILYQLWAFVAPGLYKHEKRLAVPLLISSVALFYMGILFAYYVVFPLVFGFFTSIGPESVSIATDIGRYLDFVLSIFFGFGLAFEVPIATIIIIALGITTPEKLAEKRPFVIVGAFIIGMLLTPPDVISQVLLAVPIWILFESGLIAAKYLLPARDEKMEDAEPESEANSIGGAMYGEDYEVIDDPALRDDAETDPDMDNEDYRPLSDEEMEAELDLMEEDDDLEDTEADTPLDKDKKDSVKKDLDQQHKKALTDADNKDLAVEQNDEVAQLEEQNLDSSPPSDSKGSKTDDHSNTNSLMESDDEKVDENETDAQRKQRYMDEGP